MLERANEECWLSALFQRNTSRAVEELPGWEESLYGPFSDATLYDGVITSESSMLSPDFRLELGSIHVRMWLSLLLRLEARIQVGQLWRE